MFHTLMTRSVKAYMYSYVHDARDVWPNGYGVTLQSMAERVLRDP